MSGIKEGFPGSRMLVLPKSVVDKYQEDAFMSQMFPVAIGFFPRAEFHQIIREQGVEDNVMIFCSDGKGWINVDGTEVEMSAGKIAIIPASSPHSYGADLNDPWTIYWIHFRGSLSSKFVNPKKLTFLDLMVAEYSNTFYRLNIFEELFRILSIGYSDSNLFHSSVVLLHFLSSLCNTVSSETGSQRSSSSGNIVEDAKHFMLENLGKKLTLRQICDYVGCSPSTCSAAFKNTTGMSPVEFFLHQKIQTACRMLLTTDYKINQISSSIGIDDQYYFSRLFTKMMGVPPSQYRNKK